MNRPNNQGFALIITLVVVSIILAIGLSLLFVTTKQYLLTVTASQSELAFQAAQIGLECMRWHRAQPATLDTLLQANGAPVLGCAGVTTPYDSSASTVYSNNGRFFYNYLYMYNISNNRCVSTNMYLADFREATSDFTLPDVDFTCRAGTICTAIFSGGFNRPCDQLDSIFTVHRELLIEY